MARCGYCRLALNTTTLVDCGGCLDRAVRLWLGPLVDGSLDVMVSDTMYMRGDRSDVFTDLSQHRPRSGRSIYRIRWRARRRQHS